jgi:hypothetical protein
MTPAEARALVVGQYVKWWDDPALTGQVILVTPNGFAVKWVNGSIEFVRYEAEHLKQIDKQKEG